MRIADDIIYISDGEILLECGLKELINRYKKVSFRNAEEAKICKFPVFGLKRVKEGYEALVKREDLSHFKGEAKDVDLDEIIIHLETEKDNEKMFLNLLKKEFTLALHPTSVVFVFFAAFVFIPNYPYEVMCFFSCLSIYFMCLSGRENKDIFFTCMLPDSERTNSSRQNCNGGYFTNGTSAFICLSDRFESFLVA